MNDPTLFPPTPVVVVLMGASGAGKSTLARRLASHPGVLAVSYDQCREELVGDPGDQSATVAAVELAHHRVALRCQARTTTVVDATHTTATERRPLVDLANRHGMPAVLIALTTPLDLCLRRQETRAPRLPGAPWGRRVPDNVVRGQHARVTAAGAHRRLPRRAPAPHPPPHPRHPGGGSCLT